MIDDEMVDKYVAMAKGFGIVFQDDTTAISHTRALLEFFDLLIEQGFEDIENGKMDSNSSNLEGQTTNKPTLNN